MVPAAVYKEIMRSYETAQNDAVNLRDRRLANLYKTLPRVREIDRETARLGLEWARNPQPHIRQQRDTLALEKKALMNDKNIPENYLTDIYVCALCNDTGYINAQSDNPQRCKCLKQKLINKGYAMSNLAQVLARENFSAFDVDLYGTAVHPEEGLSPRKNIERVRKECERFVFNFAKAEANLLFYGSTGLGKTFLCHCIAKALLDKGNNVLYITAPRLFKLIQAHQFNKSNAEETEDILEGVTECDLLILDDLGTEFSTIVTDSALFEVINQRLLDCRATLISTNLTMAELENQYTERIVSRLIGSYTWHKFFGEDIRVKKKERALTKG